MPPSMAMGLIPENRFWFDTVPLPLAYLGLLLIKGQGLIIPVAVVIVLTRVSFIWERAAGAFTSFTRSLIRLPGTRAGARSISIKPSPSFQGYLW